MSNIIKIPNLIRAFRFPIHQKSFPDIYKAIRQRDEFGPTDIRFLVRLLDRFEGRAIAATNRPID